MESIRIHHHWLIDLRLLFSPFDSRMWQALAQCYQKLAKYVNVIDKCSFALNVSLRVVLLGRPHEVLKCFKRSQMLVEATDLGNLRQLAEHCLSMGLFEEAAMYWTRLVAVARVSREVWLVLYDVDVKLNKMPFLRQGTDLPIQEYGHAYIQLAAYEMGEHHVAHSRPRVIGELSLAEVYLLKVISLDNEVSSACLQPPPFNTGSKLSVC